MDFTTIAYYGFLAIVFLLVQLGPIGLRPYVLLAASFFFYASFGIPYFLLLLALIALNYFLGIALSSAARERFGKYLLAFGVLLNLAPLFVYKFLFSEMGSVEASLKTPLDFSALAFPLGISFYTFHSVSYLVDVYSRKISAERNFGFLSLYIVFFPQLIAGPIMRGRELIPQFHGAVRPEIAQIERSLLRIYFGLFKKLVVTNALFLFLRAFLEAPEGFGAAVALLAVITARYYIFADFSAYTDIAIGSAGIFGIRFGENFWRPFASRSIMEYWQRWHISLSTWMRDYVYFPLLATPVAYLGPYVILLLTFSAIGLWHGFTWNFVLYGVWNGVMLALYDLYAKRRLKRKKSGPVSSGRGVAAAQVAGTFLLCVCPPTVLFVTKDLHRAAAVYAEFFSGWRLEGLAELPKLFGGRLGTAVFGICAVEFVQLLQAKGWLESLWRRIYPFRFLVYMIFALALLLFGDFARHDFVYFRF